MAYSGDAMHYNGSDAQQHTLQGYYGTFGVSWWRSLKAKSSQKTVRWFVTTVWLPTHLAVRGSAATTWWSWLWQFWVVVQKRNGIVGLLIVLSRTMATKPWPWFPNYTSKITWLPSRHDRRPTRHIGRRGKIGIRGGIRMKSSIAAPEVLLWLS